MAKELLNSSEVAKVIAKGARDDLINFALAVQDPFILNWHHELIADRLMQIFKGIGKKNVGLKNLMIEAPPQITNKSTMIQLFIAYCFGHHPQLNAILSSYDKTQANAGSSKIMNYINSQEYNDIFGIKIHPRKRAVSSWCTTGHKDGLLTTNSMQAAKPGRPSSLNIIDDPFKGSKEAASKKINNSVWKTFVELQQRLLPGTGATVLINTRWHYHDIHGRLVQYYKEELKKPIEEDWEIITLPAIADKDYEWTLSDGRTVGYKKGESLIGTRFSVADMESVKKTQGTKAWQAQYMQDPVANDVQLFKPSLWQHITKKELEKLKETMRFKRVLMLDTSSGNDRDYTGFADVIFDIETKIWYVEAWREKLKTSEIEDKVAELHVANDYDAIGIEATVQGQFIAETLGQSNPQLVDMNNTPRLAGRIKLPVLLIKSENRSKESRIEAALLGRYERGEIIHIDKKCDILEEELEMFPSAPNDDTSDALAYVDDLLKNFSIEVEEEVQSYEPPTWDFN